MSSSYPWRVYRSMPSNIKSNIIFPLIWKRITSLENTGVYHKYTKLSKRFITSHVGEYEKVESSEWDVIISGGGLVGSALACALGSSKILSEKRILLLESNKVANPVHSEKYSNRVSALNLGTKSLFESFGAWQKICDTRMQVVKKLQVWESCSDARIIFQYPEMSSEVAFIVENDVILKSLSECLATLDQVKVITGAKATKYNFPTDSSNANVIIQLEDGRVLKTKFLVGADGINSLVRTAMNVKQVHWNYHQKGLVATLKLSEPTDNVVAWQRFLPSGPIALLPLKDDLCSLVWTVSIPMSEKLLQLSDEEFVDALNTALWDDAYKNPVAESAISVIKNILSFVQPDRLNIRQLPPSILSVEENSRAAFPLGLGLSTKYVAPRVALIGDAAHRVHPLAGQGVNLGFADIQCLVMCLEESVYNGNDIGDVEPLLEYEMKRQRHVVPTVAFIDALNRVYGTEFTPLVVLRSLGVTLLDAIMPIKDQIIKHASS